MKSHPILVGFLVLATCAGMAYAVWDRTHPLRTPEETESAFLKNYTPKSVMEHFDAEKGTAVSSHSGGGSGRESVSHQSGFQSFFAIKTENWLPLMNALRDDASAQLMGNGARILNQSGDARDGFHFEYKLGNSIGTLTILPLEETSTIHRAMPLCKGLVDVTPHIEQTETWFSKEPSTITARVTD